jgi:hypothetical protein
MAKKSDAIAKIAVRGFKSIIDEQEIELRPLTLLAGANSSGKSSIMQPLLLLKQTLEAPSDPGPLLLDGPNVRFTSAEQLLSKIGKTRRSEFAVRIELSNGACIAVVFKRAKGTGFELDAMEYRDNGEALRIVPNMSHDEIVKGLPDSIKVLHTNIEEMEKERLYWSVHRERCFFSFGLSRVETGSPLVSFGPGVSPSGQFIPRLQGLIHLPGLRGNPQRTYSKSAGGPFFPGTFENYIASIIAQWQSADNNHLARLGLALEGMGLTWKVDAKPVEDTQVELRVGRLAHSKQGGAHDLVNIADVGFGVSQSLPVVVALIAARPGQVVYFEQPEIHLHPRAQRRLAHALADAANRGVVVVAETHSSLLIREVQTVVATGELSTDKVILHWVQRQEDGRTIITPANLDENGAYGDWPEDFDEVELDAEKTYLDAVERKRAGK